MPKVSNAFLDHQNTVRAWIGRGIFAQKIRTQKELARRIGMPATTFSNRMSHPENFRLEEIWEIERIIGKMEG